MAWVGCHVVVLDPWRVPRRARVPSTDPVAPMIGASEKSSSSNKSVSVLLNQ